MNGPDLPAALTAGDVWSFPVCPPAWFASASAVVVTLKPADGGAPRVLPADLHDSGWIVTVEAVDTLPILPGPYVWSVVSYTTSGVRHAAPAGRVTVAPDPLTFDGDGRTASERVLAEIDARIEGRARSDVDSYTIEGRSLARTPLPELLRLRGVYHRRVLAERGGPGAAPFAVRRVEFR